MFNITGYIRSYNCCSVEDGEPEVYDWEKKSWRPKDWVEELSCDTNCEDYDVDNGDFLYIDNEELKKFW